MEKRQEHILYYPGAAAESEPMGFSGEEYKKVILESSCIWQKHEKYMARIENALFLKGITKKKAEVIFENERKRG